MSFRIQTTIEASQPTIVLLARPGVFATQLRLAIEAIHLAVVVIDPITLINSSLDSETQAAMKQGYACIWIDSPIFISQSARLNDNLKIISHLKRSLHCPLRFVAFDAAYARKNGEEGRVPTHISQELLRSVMIAFPKASILTYFHVFYPFDGGLSVVHRFIFEKIIQGNVHPLVGCAAPLWYADVIEHLVSGLYDVESSSGSFTGPSMIDFSTIESELRKHARFPSTKGKSQVFPFVFPEAVAIGKTSWQAISLEISLTLPQNHPTKTGELVASTTIFPQKKTTRKNSGFRFSQHRITQVVGALCLGFFTFYISTTIVFLMLLVGVRDKLALLSTQSSSPVWSQYEVERLEKKAVFLQNIAQIVPLPYPIIGLQLPREGVIEGLRGVSRLLSGVAKYHQATELLVQRTLLTSDKSPNDTTLQDINTHLETGYKELSEIQSDISKGNSILDTLFGVDGLSVEIVRSLSSIREEITQRKAAASLVGSFLPSSQSSTLLVVSNNSIIARPLFGAPTQVLVVEIDQGKMVSSQVFSISVLDEMLRGKVELPLDFQSFVGGKTWKLSSGAWSVDGPTAARQIAWFVSKQLHIEADGILFIDDALVGRILSQLGSGIATSTVLGVTSQTNGLSSVLTLLGSNDHVQALKGLEILTESLNASQATLFSRDASTAKTLKALAWDGGVRTPSCPTAFVVDRTCEVSTRYVVEYDFPEVDQEESIVSKDNQIHQLSISKDSIVHSDLITYPKANAYGNKKLVKYLIDKNATIISISVNGEVLLDRDALISDEFEKTSVSVPITLSNQRGSAISLVYSTPALHQTQSSLVFFAQKQVGKVADPFTLEVKYSKDYRLSLVAPRGLIDRTGVSFTTALQANKVFALGFE